MERRCLLVVRIRGGVNTPYKIEDTLKMLRVERNNMATLIDNRPDYMGMLQNAKDWITWGEPTLETIRLLLEKRGKISGGGRIKTDTLTDLGYKSINELAEDLYTCLVDFNKLDGIKPFFRLHPPSRGFKRTVKRPYQARGELGYRGEAINDLTIRMC